MVHPIIFSLILNMRFFGISSYICNCLKCAKIKALKRSDLFDIMSYKISMDGELTPPRFERKLDVKIKRFPFSLSLKFLGLKLKLKFRI